MLPLFAYSNRQEQEESIDLIDSIYRAVFLFIYFLVPADTRATMDNRGRFGDSDRDRDRDRDSDRDRPGSSQRRNNNDRDERRDPSSTGSNSQGRRIDEEEETSHYRSQIAPRNTNITTNRVVPASNSNNVVMERFYAYGIGPGIPMKPGGKSAAVVSIQ